MKTLLCALGDILHVLATVCLLLFWPALLLAAAVYYLLSWRPGGIKA